MPPRNRPLPRRAQHTPRAHAEGAQSARRCSREGLSEFAARAKPRWSVPGLVRSSGTTLAPRRDLARDQCCSPSPCVEFLRRPT